MAEDEHESTARPELAGAADDLVAIRRAYDTVADNYAELLADELAKKLYDRAMLAAFAEIVRAADGGCLVADLGCGPGRITAHLNELGLDAFGLDLSPRMIAVARQRHPTVAFDVGSLEAIALPAGALAGVVAWYSIIHTPPERLPNVFAEFARVLIPGGVALVAFQAVSDAGLGASTASGGPVTANPMLASPVTANPVLADAEPRHLTHAYGHDIDLDVYRLPPDGISELLNEAGFTVEATLIRNPDDEERTQQAFLLARRT